MKRKRFLILLILFLLLAGGSLIYLSTYSEAEQDALDALSYAEETDYGYFFDGEGEEDLFIFYPGGKVDEKAYAPLLKELSEGGIDVSLVKMPFHLAIFGMDKADRVDTSSYRHIYLGGHSLGGVMAARYAVKHLDDTEGLILLASYADKPLNASERVLLIYGSNDGVLNTEKYEEAKENLPEGYEEYLIQGGNHAGFASYGKQKGDGEAQISSAEQVEETAGYILSFVH